MKIWFRKNVFLIFWVIALLDIIGISFQVPILHMVFKPMLMPLLIIAILLLAGNTAGRIKIIIGLLFSFLGDVFLLIPSTNSIYFILGLSAFLITHVFYISYFIQQKGGASLIKKAPWLVLLILAHSCSLLYLLMPQLGDLKIPVIVYSCIISLMLFFSLCLPFTLNSFARKLFIAGAVSFVISDSLLAIDKFYEPFSFAAVLIMASYCMAQFLIVKGFIITRD